jgi:hypothetical protein
MAVWHAKYSTYVWHESGRTVSAFDSFGQYGAKGNMGQYGARAKDNKTYVCINACNYHHLRMSVFSFKQVLERARRQVFLERMMSGIGGGALCIFGFIETDKCFFLVGLGV